MHHSLVLEETRIKSTILLPKGGCMKKRSRERAYS
jgi:hypothetical protein